KSGKYLYFTASTNLGPAFSFAEMSTFPHQSTRSVYAVVLRSDLPSPLVPESDEEKPADSKAGGSSDEKKATAAAAGAPAADTAAKPPAEQAKKEVEPVRIDFDGIDQRIVALPIPPRNFIGLAVGKAGTVDLIELPPQGAHGTPNPFGPALTLHKFDLEKRKFDKVLDGISAFDVSFNGEKMLFRQGPAWIIASTMAPPKPGEGVLKTGDIQVRVDPKAEWRQMYDEVWRGERDFFYDPNLHGLNLAEYKKKYEPYLEAVAHRSDLTYLFREMLNELTVGHMFVFGGDLPRPTFVRGGLLGCDYRVENGRYRIAKVYNGEHWNPQLRAPLTQPGVNVKTGDYLLAVSGREVRGTDNVYSFFEATAGKQIVIKAGPNPDGSGSREVTVVPVD